MKIELYTFRELLGRLQALSAGRVSGLKDAAAFDADPVGYFLAADTHDQHIIWNALAGRRTPSVVSISAYRRERR